ncbi:hypothetical protein CIB95_03910 [Lottiidibacillus patelloidae]|uniref:Uncharacterized protein n=1 Tax=Lottiidibacillus patelloidae TaxID=2670334 RepID=A0A263BUW2_9BACI|nr:hypothetical protein [Lottiidibacillus patelloidae]OZM57524.1 hypothetical protein CIB95_03910 [Lottiidibacillus patelloidae]
MYMQRVIVVEANKEPYLLEIENNFSEMQNLVKGSLNFQYLANGYFVIHHTGCNKEFCYPNYELHGTLLITKGLENIDESGISGISLQESEHVIKTLIHLKEANFPIAYLPSALSEKLNKIS